MTDFLDRLIERTLGLTHTIEPLTPSIYAPKTTRKGEPFLEDDREGLLTRQVETDWEPADLAVPPAPQTDFPELDRTAPATPSFPLAAETKSRTDRLPAAIDLDMPPTVQIRENFLPKTAQPSIDRDSSQETESSPLPLPPVPPENGIPGKAVESTAAPAILPHQNQENWELTAKINVSEPFERPKPQLPSPLPAPTTPLPSDRPLNSSVRDSLPARDRPPKQEEPIVRVKIGRIEVRALQPPPPIPPPAPLAPPAPQLSLDDYLQLRQGGKR